ncbi:sulfite exporter TauE/SafE family protein [Streptomyces sp. NPDC005349]|uniref:sulfite exporter TauE/SafE family protein n=1 Tax=Streptomyces sp. NPDC005349 TaxID=3157037 RepID=UPI0033A05167
MDGSTGLLGFAAGLLISVATAPVGVSGAVFLLPVQVSVLGVPSPAVTPTNLLYNVVAGPGALFRYRQAGRLRGPLTRLLITGTLPGVVLGALIRVFAVPGPRVFRLLVAALLLPLGLWLWRRTVRPAPARDPRPPSPGTTRLLALVVGVVGGIYGIGGGSLLAPILVGRGTPAATVAPAALASTFVTSIVGTVTYALLSLTTTGDVAPDWLLGLTCGAGGLLGGYLGAHLQPRLPETTLRLLLAALATGVGALYAVQVLCADRAAIQPAPAALEGRS